MNLNEYISKTNSELANRNIHQLNLWDEISPKFGISRDDPKYIDGFRRFATFFNNYRDEHGIDLDKSDLDNAYVFKKIKDIIKDK